ncbi:ABC transporter ATP-binding protein [Saccharibacillus sp. CPCC 101409]|uniref:ABC transporter ATP-binding protein n=1 Tax=Saccharibacillus sp. CPCC 101409 TaxID=3058041 RepID=UPI002672296F|nr:ABC transporter ATP-binding protein [Saccharibacillus sp. CPCC 101409]MDO3408696.1 ABC transporter ATP-binding protein [Saccharibacillus sp. CPCC 101409]
MKWWKPGSGGKAARGWKAGRIVGGKETGGGGADSRSEAAGERKAGRTAGREKPGEYGGDAPESGGARIVGRTSADDSPAIELRGAVCRYGGFRAVGPLDWTVRRGEFWAVLGPNGSGKSSLLGLVSGAERLAAGEVRLLGRPAAGYGRRELARRLAVLPQEGLPPLGVTVRDALELGRFPYRDRFGRERNPAAAEELLARIAGRLELTALLERRLDELSGGQRQRAALGQVMAQQPEILLLDEPTAYLDIYYQLDVMELVREWRAEAGLTVVAVLHDPNLAAQYAERLLLLREGRAAGSGPAQSVLTAEAVGALYGVAPPIVVRREDIGAPQLLFRAARRPGAEPPRE